MPKSPFVLHDAYVFTTISAAFRKPDGSDWGARFGNAGWERLTRHCENLLRRFGVIRPLSMYAVTPPSPFEHGRFASIALVPGAPVAAEPLERLCKGQGSSQDALSDELVGEEDGRISPVALRCMSDYFAQSRSLAADHISSLLELLAFFVFNGMFDLAHRHMESRLDWLPDYRDTLRKKAAHCRFYCELLDVIISLVASPMQRELIGHYCNGAGGPGGAGGAKGAKGAGGPDGAGGTGSAASPR